MRKLAGLVSVGLAVGACAPVQGPRSSESPPAIVTWTGQGSELPFPGRVSLPESTCYNWAVNHPQPGVLKSGKLFLVIDARASLPADCNPITDIGAGRQAGASVQSGNAMGPNGERYVPDGTVVQVLAAQVGEYACRGSAGNGSDTWLKVWDGTGNPETSSFMVSSPNVGFVSAEQLALAGIPRSTSDYAGTRQGGC